MSGQRPIYNEDLGTLDGRENLWRTVLSHAIKEALTGEGLSGDYVNRLREIEEARTYIVRRNRDFNEVCNLAGLDPDAVRDAVIKQLATAPSPEVLATTKRTKRGRPSLSPSTGADHDHAA